MRTEEERRGRTAQYEDRKGHEVQTEEPPSVSPSPQEGRGITPPYRAHDSHTKRGTKKRSDAVPSLKEDGGYIEGQGT